MAPTDKPQSNSNTQQQCTVVDKPDTRQTCSSTADQSHSGDEQDGGRGLEGHKNDVDRLPAWLAGFGSKRPKLQVSSWARWLCWRQEVPITMYFHISTLRGGSAGG